MSQAPPPPPPQVQFPVQETNGLGLAGFICSLVGLFTGDTWWLDTNHDFNVDTPIGSAIEGYPIVGDFDGDGNDDLGTWTDDMFRFDLAFNGFGQEDAKSRSASSEFASAP